MAGEGDVCLGVRFGTRWCGLSFSVVDTVELMQRHHLAFSWWAGMVAVCHLLVSSYLHEGIGSLCE